MPISDWPYDFRAAIEIFIEWSEDSEPDALSFNEKLFDLLSTAYERGLAEGAGE